MTGPVIWSRSVVLIRAFSKWNSRSGLWTSVEQPREQIGKALTRLADAVSRRNAAFLDIFELTKTEMAEWLVSKTIHSRLSAAFSFKQHSGDKFLIVVIQEGEVRQSR